MPRPVRVALLAALAASALAAQPPQGLQRGTAPPARPVPEPPAPTPSELVAPPEDAVRLPSGLAYKVLRQGEEGALPPADQDVVALFVIGRSPAGEVFQNSFAQGRPQRMQVRNTFPAWREAMKTMLPGEIRRWWFPADRVPPNPKSGRREPAVFDVALVDIGRIPNPPRYLAEPDPKARTTVYGASVLTVRPGKTGAKVTRSDGAMINFTYWRPTGEAISSSFAEGRPTLFPMDKVMPAFADCLEGMTVEEKRQCWIPAARNEGFPAAPSGALVFELELLSIVDTDKLLGSARAAAAPPPQP
jgi:FKBP-type peptidyl-prolyl cis-trans isomerase